MAPPNPAPAEPAPAAHESPAAFRVRMSQYEGPLDLLVQLVKQRELNILHVAIAQIIHSYRKLLVEAAALDLDSVGEFVVGISLLMEAKARVLIPQEARTRQRGGSDDDAELATGEDLIRRVLEYKRFKEAAARLWEQARRHQLMLPRVPMPMPAPKVDPGTQAIKELELWDLVSAFSRLMKAGMVPVTDAVVIDPTPISVYMERLLAQVNDEPRTFRDLIGPVSRAQLVNQFLALLELIKQKQVWVELEPGVGEIYVMLSRPAEALLVRAEAAPASADEPAWPAGAASTVPFHPGGTASAWDDFEPLDARDDRAPGAAAA